MLSYVRHLCRVKLFVFDRAPLQAEVYRTFVIEHEETQQLAATGTLLVEAAHCNL